MEASNTEKLGEFYKKMIASTDYLGMADLKDQYSYKIFARNAYVGVWMKMEKAFLISRYKFSLQSYMFFEYHWDAGEPFGTVKTTGVDRKMPF